MRISVLIIILSIINFTSLSNSLIGDAIDKSLESVTSNIKKEVFKGQIVKGNRNGVGVLRYKNGIVYIGDFYRDKISGYGMLISDAEIGIKYCNNSIVYVGNWKDGKKNGYGRCYNENGDLVYQGQFINDKPVDYYTINPNEDNVYFKISYLDDDRLYIGEAKDGQLEGFGTIIVNNGDMWIGSFKKDAMKGVGLFIAYDNEWEAINISENGTIKTISTSERYKQIDAETEERKKTLSGILCGTLTNIAVSGAELATGIQQLDGNSAVCSTVGQTDAVKSCNGSSNDNNYKLMYDKWAHRAERDYKSLTNLGYSLKTKSKISGSAGGKIGGGNYVAQKRSFREAQKEMRNIRLKAQKAGVSISQSKWETATIEY